MDRVEKSKEKYKQLLERPYIICHMLTPLDGKIIGDYLKVERAAYFTDEYEKIHERYGCIGGEVWTGGQFGSL